MRSYDPREKQGDWGCVAVYAIFFIVIIVPVFVCLLQNGNTPLHLSCIKGYHDIAALLLCNGADKTIRNEVVSLFAWFSVSSGDLAAQDGKTAIAYVQSSSSLAALEVRCCSFILRISVFA